MSINKYFYRARGFYRMNLAGHEFFVNPDDWHFWRTVKQGKWEPSTFHILSQFIKKDSICLDIGAYIGPIALFASRICKKIYCIEPDPYAYEKLLTNIRLNKISNIIPVQCAIHNMNGVINLGCPDGIGKSTTSILTASEKNTFTVESKTIDSFIDTWGIERLDFLKIDAEGSEFFFLPSFKEMLIKWKPTLYLSVHPVLLPKEIRLEKTKEAILNTIDIYDKFYDENLERIDPEILLNENNLNKVCELVCTNE